MRIKNPISRGGEGWLTQVFYNLIESDQKFNSKSFTEDLGKRSVSLKTLHQTKHNKMDTISENFIL